MSKTKIEWTEKVWNPVTGCTKVSEGCKNCYAETIAKRFWKDRKFSDVQLHPERLEQPLHWKKPSIIFVNSMSDLFHEAVPFEFVGSIWRIMQECSQHIFQILTKRPARLLSFLDSRDYPIIGGLRKDENIWLGVSVENQKTADERIPILLETPAKVRWISVEPMLEEIDITPFLKKSIFLRDNGEGKLPTYVNGLNWVVVGGESGTKARECNVFWIKNIVEQCKQANVPVFVKQLGSKPIYDKTFGCYKGVKIIVDGKGKNDKIKDFPEDLQVREYPKEK